MEDDILKRREYQLDVYYKKKLKYIKLLGGKCVKCDSIYNLEFDHINPIDKEYTITIGWTKPDSIIIKEIEKCQLLCEECHKIKSIEESGKTVIKNRDIHGTISSVRYCKCPICKEFKSTYNKIARIKKLGNVKPKPKSPHLDKVNEIINLSKEGFSSYKISSMVNIHRSSVERIIRKYKKST